MNMFKWPNKYADVFVISIDSEKEEIVYDVRDKDTGVSVEPRRTSKFVIDDLGKSVHFNNRECPLDLFKHIYSVLQ